MSVCDVGVTLISGWCCCCALRASCDDRCTHWTVSVRFVWLVSNTGFSYVAPLPLPLAGTSPYSICVLLLLLPLVLDSVMGAA